MKCLIKTYLLCVLCASTTMSVSASSRIPRSNLGIRTFDARNKRYTTNLNSSTNSNTNHALRKVGGGGSTRGGASAVAAPLAAKTMSANQYKVLNLFSGGVAGTIASCITNPLEVVKTQLQSSMTSSAIAMDGELASSAGGLPVKIAQRIFQADGIKGFWKGLRPTLIGIIPARSIYFYSYEQSKRSLGQNVLLPEGSVGNALISGFVAGICSNTVTNPIWMVKTRYQLLADHSAGQRAYTSYGDAISTIMREEGVGGFYRGIFASYWGCLEGAVQFLLYEQLKSKLIAEQNEDRRARGLPETVKLPKLTYFCSAAFAKGVAAIATYPHEVARTRLREQARSGVFKYKGMWQTIGIIAKEEGRGGLYAGMGVHLVKVVPNSAIMFLTYELVNSWLSQFTISDS